VLGITSRAAGACGWQYARGLGDPARGGPGPPAAQLRPGCTSSKHGIRPTVVPTDRGAEVPRMCHHRAPETVRDRTGARANPPLRDPARAQVGRRPGRLNPAR
jgi:hypothetical protein